MSKKIKLEVEKVRLQIDELNDKLEPGIKKLNYLRHRITDLQFKCEHDNATYTLEIKNSHTIDGVFRYLYRVRCCDCGFELLTDDEEIIKRYNYLAERY